MQFDQRLYQALLRNDFRAFLEKSFRTLSPGDQYVWNWHIGAIAWHLERVRRRKIKRLIINMPPRSLKSLTASVAWPAFLLGRDPSLRLICISYSGELAKKFSNDFRALIEAPFYKSLFPWTRVGRFKDSEVETEFTARGYRLATSVGGTLTGRGGDIIIIDDPLKPDDALSEAKRSAANQWFTNTLLSRLDDKRTGAIVIVMQRIHMDDLTGFLLNQSDEWTVLSLPAVADYDATIPISDGGVYCRKLGEALSLEREPLHVLDNIKQQIGSDAFSAQYQQSPVPPGGLMILRSWVKRYSELPPQSEQFLTMQSWDTASKGGPNNDWSVCTTWILTRKQKWYLIDVWRQRVDYPTLKANVQHLAKRFRARRVLVEDTGAGIGLVQELQNYVPGIVAVKPEGDKASRMAIASAKFEAGQVLLPEQATWLPDLEAELFSFPGSRYDDQCDSISQALSNNNNNYSVWELLSPEDWQRLLADARKPGPRTIYGTGPWGRYRGS
jgi:predicted phage terminase large subunit-like protein